MFIVYLPQYVVTAKHGADGISARFILYQALFSTAQLALRLVNYPGRRAVRYSLSSTLQGIRGFSVFIGDLQILAQPLCTLIWYGSISKLM